ncbi:Uma2 family endonuclease [Baaleninema sp.]|uniref:Uma2 family endonuclease n=1 Tax=Baaleninema sp. TaxID=3101197 RepID=UPI003CFD51CC
MVLDTTVQKTSLEDYFNLEESSEIKHEYRDGELIEMTGGTTNHNAIVVAMVAYLFFGLQGKNAQVFSGDVRLWIPQHNLFTYPDVMVVSGDVEYYENRQDTILNPSVIVEVLSKSTKAYDKTDKFDYYRSLPSFQEYLVINQYRYSLEQYVKRDEGKWSITYYESEDDALNLASMDIELALRDIYANVKLESSEL